jgi:RNA polymerase sigma-70 factor (ECF subfamily)
MLSQAQAVGHGPEQAEDIVQDVMVRMWRHPDRYDPDRGTVASFLLIQCRGRAIDLRRAEIARRRRQQLLTGSATPLSDPVADHIVRALGMVTLFAMLDRLPQDERLAIRIAFFGDRTYRQTADLLGVPEGTVKSRIRSGLRHLRDLLDT